MSEAEVEKEMIKPWHRQPWFWFLMIPLIVVVINMSIFMTIAYKNADDVVIDNYYKQGRMINQSMEQQRHAQALSLAADLMIDTETGDVTLTMVGNSDFPDQMLVLVGHPFEADLDQLVVVSKISDRYYRGELTSKIAHSWYITLMPDTDLAQRKNVPWILSGQIHLAVSPHVLLEPKVY